MHTKTSTYEMWLVQPNEELDLAIKVGEQPSKVAPSDALYSQNALFANKDDKGVYHPIGSVVKGGKVYYEPLARPKWCMFVVPKSGRAYVTHSPPAISDRKLSFYGTPQLLKNGAVNITSKLEGTASDIANSSAIRSAIGVKSNGQIGLIKTLTNHTLTQLANLMRTLGFVDAVNLDGGGSSVTHRKGEPHVWQRPTSSALYVKQVKESTKDGKPILIIDAGHGGADPGAQGNGIVEKIMNLAISLYQYKRFQELGVPVALTRDRDMPLDSIARTNVVKSSGAKYCISNHINAGGGVGVETIHSIYTSNKLAKTLADAIVREGQTFRRVFSRTLPNNANQDYYYMHRLTGNVETIIIEYGFVDNASDAKKVRENWERYAEAVVKAFCEYIGHPYVVPSPPTLDKLYRVQVGAFGVKSNADNLAKELKELGFSTVIKEETK